MAYNPELGISFGRKLLASLLQLSRKVLFWVHLLVGVSAGLVILVMAVTGTLLTYERQVVAWMDQRPVSAGTRLPIEALLGQLPGATGVVLRADPTEAVTVSVGRETILVDPASGVRLAPPHEGVRDFFRWVTAWHRWLGADAGHRTTARAFTGAANLAFLFLVLSGLYLWLPRKWRWPNLRAVLWFRGGLSGKARDFNWHNAAGFWCCVPLFFVVVSGVVISYPWASDIVYRANGVQPPSRGKGKGGPREGNVSRAASLLHLDVLVARAQKQVTGWRSISFQVPVRDEEPVTFNIDAGSGGQPQNRSSVTLDRATGAVIRSTNFAAQDAGQRARSWMRFVHTGEYYGLAGQTIAGIASAGGALLVWTGMALAWRRFRAWTARR